MPENKRDTLNILAQAVQVLAVVTGVVISVLSFNETKRKESEKAQVEASKPFLILRQKLYMEAIQNAAILANPSSHDSEELRKATKRFWELYWAELCMVESKGVEAAMIGFGGALTSPNSPEKDRQQASVKLAHVLRDSLIESWGIVDKTSVGAVNR